MVTLKHHNMSIWSCLPLFCKEPVATVNCWLSRQCEPWLLEEPSKLVEVQEVTEVHNQIRIHVLNDLECHGHSSLIVEWVKPARELTVSNLRVRQNDGTLQL